ncbi:uncharacterized protein [Physcomitrium patens]|uniref:uncharacterized protein isoform X3 n=1 Tax=Physcomitrium patens TaxID=3218 RepID=UPI003CCD1AE5
MAAVAEILSAQPDVQLPDVQIDFSGGSRSGENADPGNDTERCARNLEELNNEKRLHAVDEEDFPDQKRHKGFEKLGI